jgi:hypothetical protein
MNQVDEAQPVMEKPKPPQPQPTSINQKQPPMPPIEGGGQVQKPPVGDYQQGPAVNQLPPQQPQQPQPPQPPSQQIP